VWRSVVHEKSVVIFGGPCCAANGYDGKTEAEILAELGGKFPKHNATHCQDAYFLPCYT
jgi:hypothetical protein